MSQNKQEAIDKLKDLLEGIDFCMLTTISGGELRSRPMSTQTFDESGDLWFFTSDNTHKIEEIGADDRVNVAYSQPDDNRYVSVSGRAELSKDRGKIEKLWSPILKAWFPDGVEDQHLALLRISVENAEYCESSSSTLVQIAGFVKAIVTGEQIDAGDNAKIAFN